MIQKIPLEQFLLLAQDHPLLDVRSPAEYNHAHIPGALSLPLFNDDERKVVGTTYKQQSREQAIKIGLDYFGIKMRKIVEEVEAIAMDRKTKTVMVHCWRGGMRSEGVAWLLNLYGFKIYTLTGGYKTFRNWVLNRLQLKYELRILGGYTGSGKTNLLQELERSGQLVIDLEGLANHKGSAFGALGERSQPSQEMFENLLATQLFLKIIQEKKKHPETNTQPLERFWLEDESQRIGLLNIPKTFFEQMRNSDLYFLDIPFEERLEYLVTTYGKFDPEKLVNAIMRIQKRLGGLETKMAINFLLEKDITSSFSILLKYYDKLYTKGLHNRVKFEELLNIIPCTNVNTAVNLDKLLLQEV